MLTNSATGKIFFGSFAVISIASLGYFLIPSTPDQLPNKMQPTSTVTEPAKPSVVNAAQDSHANPVRTLRSASPNEFARQIEELRSVARPSKSIAKSRYRFDSNAEDLGKNFESWMSRACTNDNDAIIRVALYLGAASDSLRTAAVGRCTLQGIDPLVLEEMTKDPDFWWKRAAAIDDYAALTFASQMALKSLLSGNASQKEKSHQLLDQLMKEGLLEAFDAMSFYANHGFPQEHFKATAPGYELAALVLRGEMTSRQIADKFQLTVRDGDLPRIIETARQSLIGIRHQ